MTKKPDFIEGKDYKHFVVTLFNVKNFLDGTRNEDLWLEWTINRISVFFDYCFPSVLSQSTQNFTWLLYFDSSTPVEIIEGFKARLTGVNAVVMLKTGYDEFYNTYTDDMMNLMPAGVEWVVQTRFDNDDILHPDALQTVQGSLVLEDKFKISMSSGYTFQQSTGWLSHYFYSMGPFLTIIESSRNKIKGIYHCNHWQWDGLKLKIFEEILVIIKLKKPKTHFILSQPLWIQMIHGANMHNTADRGFPVLYRKDLKEFSEKIIAVPSPLSRIKLHVHYVWWKRYFKAMVVLFLRKIFFYKKN